MERSAHAVLSLQLITTATAGNHICKAKTECGISLEKHTLITTIFSRLFGSSIALECNLFQFFGPLLLPRNSLSSHCPTCHPTGHSHMKNWEPVAKHRKNGGSNTYHYQSHSDPYNTYDRCARWLAKPKTVLQRKQRDFATSR